MPWRAIYCPVSRRSLSSFVSCTLEAELEPGAYSAFHRSYDVHTNGQHTCPQFLELRNNSSTEIVVTAAGTPLLAPAKLTVRLDTEQYVVGYDPMDNYMHHFPEFNNRTINAIGFAEPLLLSRQQVTTTNLILVTDGGKLFEYARQPTGEKLPGRLNYLGALPVRAFVVLNILRASDIPSFSDPTNVYNIHENFFEVRQVAAYRLVHAAASASHTLVVTVGKEVLAWGDMNGHGALGQGDLQPRSQPRLVEKLKGVKIEKVFVGNDVSYAIDQFGKLYAWGYGYGTLPVVVDYFQSEKPRSIVQVAVCDEIFEPLNYRNHSTSVDLAQGFTVYLTSFGEVYFSTFHQTKILPYEGINDKFIIQVACGARHALFLAEDGVVYCVYGCFLYLQRFLRG